MSLQELLTKDIHNSEYRANRDKWHAEVARRALQEADDKGTQRLLVRILLEGDLTPWSHGYDFFPSDGLQTMSWLAAGGAEPESMFDSLRKRYAESEPRCQEVWTGEHVAYRCFTCGISENSCMCVYCFDANDHVNHEFRLYSSTAGGCCDCGDPQAWRESGFCKRHKIRKEKRPSMMTTSGALGAKLACKAVVEHLIWALRRCFFLGKRRPEKSGAFGIARCFAWLNEITSVCPELCQAASEALHEKRDVWSEVIGWGNYCSAFASDMIADETGTAALLRLGCYLPDRISFELGALFLKLLLEPQYKSVFTVEFVHNLHEYLCLLLNGEPPEASSVKPRDLAAAMAISSSSTLAPVSPGSPTTEDDTVNDGEQLTVDVETSDEEEAEEETVLDATRASSNAFMFSPSQLRARPPHYNPPKAPAVLSNRELTRNARQFLDRIYCQLFHSESIALNYCESLLSMMLPKLREFFVTGCLSSTTNQLKMGKVKKAKHFYRRVLSQLNLILQHDSVCLKIIERDELWKCLLDILAACQLMDSQRRRRPDEDHIPHPNFNFKTAFGLLYELEEQLVGPVLRTVKHLGADHISLLLKRVRSTRDTLKMWTETRDLFLRNIQLRHSAHVPLSRFFFRLIDAVNHFASLNEVIKAVWPERSEAAAEQSTPPYEELIEFVGPCLSVLAFIFQIQENLWVRNGQTMFNSVLWYLKIYSYGTLEADLLACRVCIQLSLPDFVDELFENADLVLGTSNAIRLFGSLALQGTSASSVRRTAIHCLAARNCSFSELDSQSPPKSSKDLELVLKEIADFHDASIQPGGLPAHYTLKSHVWDEVEFGGFYLRWMRVDEENALSRFRRVKQKREDEPFFPVTNRFREENEIADKVLSSVTLRGACIRVCAMTVGQQLSSPSSMNEADIKTMCCVVMMAALQSMRRRHATEMFPRQSFLDLFPALESVVPSNILEAFGQLLKDETAGTSSFPEAGDNAMATEQQRTSSSAGGEEEDEEPKKKTTSAKASKAARAQQKALRAFAKKQKKFQLDDEGAERTAEAGGGSATTEASTARTREGSSFVAPEEEAEQQVCALCRKTVQDSDECLTLLICRQASVLMHSLESVAMEGEGRCVARTAAASGTGASVRSHLPEAVLGEDQPYMAARSILTCINTLREKFNTGDYSVHAGDAVDQQQQQQQNATSANSAFARRRSSSLSANSATVSGDEAYARSVNTARHLLHSCGHLIHQSCLNQYRQVVLSRSQSNQPFEGQGVIRLHQNELFCPVCRRVTSDFLPLLPSKTPSAHGTEVISQSKFLKMRLEEFRSESLPEPVTAFDEYAEEVRDFFRRCPTMVPSEGRAAPYMQFDPAGLILTHLYAAAAASSDMTPPTTIRSLLPSLMDLALRHPHLPSSADEAADFGCELGEQMVSLWSKFVNERFWGERPGRRRRQSALSVDLSLVLAEWIIYCPALRFATHAKSQRLIVEEGSRALRLLLNFARLQDTLLSELHKQSKEERRHKGSQDEEQQVRASTKSSDALRAVALTKALEDLDDPTSLHRLNQRERSQLEANIDLFINAYVDGSDAAMVAATEKLVRDSLPPDCLPLVPVDPLPDSRSESLRRNASLLLGPSVLDGLDNEDDEETKSIVASFLRRVLITFMKEVLELVGSDERPAGSSLLAATFKCSAILPSVLALPSARCSTLVRLPQDYSALTVAYVARAAVCPRCERSPDYPAICLSCGTVVCCNGLCCAVGGVDELFLHGGRCSRGTGRNTGAFLLLKTCVVVILLGENRHCVWGSLYLDAHDEEDRNLTRGKPLRLNPERFDALERVYKTQSWLMETRVLDYVRLL